MAAIKIGSLNLLTRGDFNAYTVRSMKIILVGHVIFMLSITVQNQSPGLGT
ncbi:hypothetical protein IMPR6_190096 [Imperialibacter sp. EC-SDR9]|nr:hypothetical protein IMPERIA89_120096 [Imperialibacter sp. 89]CAD5284244.1 hypothetical protein IMPERIA75_550096 [Imperialibacter sp. 75]VVT11022.1 hypothetical protein IMPR6_190096 [Imperialibacter sp. EC-SDR9]